MAVIQSPTSSELDERVGQKLHRASEIDQFQRMLFWGKSGSGKTRLVASAPRVLVIDVNEKGTTSIRRDFDPMVFSVDLWSDLSDIYWYLALGDHDYDTVALDGVTSMQNLCMKFVLGDEKARDASRDPDMPNRHVWLKVAELMKTQITNFRNLPMHVLFTALMRTRVSGDEDDNGGEVTVGPACSPSIAGHLEAAVDLIGYLTTREVNVKGKEGKSRRVVRRRLMVGAHERYVTKDRSGIFGQYIDNPNVSKMIETIYGGGTDG